MLFKKSSRNNPILLGFRLSLTNKHSLSFGRAFAALHDIAGAEFCGVIAKFTANPTTIYLEHTNRTKRRQTS